MIPAFPTPLEQPAPQPVACSDFLPGQFVTIKNGDCRTVLKELAPESIQCCVTSPPYWGLRDYGTGRWEGGDADCSHKPSDTPTTRGLAGSTLGGGKASTSHQQEGFRKNCPRCGASRVDKQIGLEETPDAYVQTMRQVFAEVWRVLKDDGTVWLNLGDSYAAHPGQRKPTDAAGSPKQLSNGGSIRSGSRSAVGLKPKDLVGIPWRVALALQADGWYLRSDIIWAKPNCMPESVTDRPTRSHEYIFLLTKRDRYYYDHEAIKEPCIYDADGTGTAARKARQNVNDKSMPTAERNGMRPPKNGGYKNSVNFDGKNKGAEKQRGHSRRHDGFNDRWDKMEREEQSTGMRNKRDVWNVAPANYREAHFATFPPDLIKPCILAGTKPGDVVLDPFGGSGTTGMVALELGRRAILVELNPEYTKLCDERCTTTRGLPLDG